MRILSGLAVGAVAALTVVLLVATANPYLGDYGDDAEFVVLGQSLAQGHGYSWINSPDHPAHNRYPPGYPLIVATAMRATGVQADAFRGIVPAKVATAATLLAALWLLWKFARCRLDAPWALGAVVLLAVNPVAIRFGVQVMSDIPFLPVLLGILLWAEYAHERPALWRWAILGALVAVGAYVRSIGLATGGGILLWVWLVRPGRTALLTTGVFVALMLPWWARDAALVGGWRYFEELTSATYVDPSAGSVSASGLTARALDNALFVIGKPLGFGVPGAIGAVGGAILLVIGAIRSARVGGGAAELAALALCFSVLLWPIKTGRYLLPIVPFLGVYGICGGLVVRTWLMERFGTRWKRPLTLAGIAGVALTGVVLLAVSVREAHQNLVSIGRGDGPAAYYQTRPEWAHYIEAAAWLHQNAGPSDVAMARRHFALYVYSGRYVEKYRFDTSEEELAYLTAGSMRKYVVLDAFDFLRGDFDPLPLALRARGGDLLLRFQTAEPAVQVWELVRPR